MHAVAQLFRNSTTGCPSRWKMSEHSGCALRASTRRAMIACSGPPRTIRRGSPVVASFPGSRTTPVSRS